MLRVLAPVAAVLSSRFHTLSRCNRSDPRSPGSISRDLGIRSKRRLSSLPEFPMRPAGSASATHLMRKFSSSRAVSPENGKCFKNKTSGGKAGICFDMVPILVPIIPTRIERGRRSGNHFAGDGRRHAPYLRGSFMLHLAGGSVRIGADQTLHFKEIPLRQERHPTQVTELDTVRLTAALKNIGEMF